MKDTIFFKFSFNYHKTQSFLMPKNIYLTLNQQTQCPFIQFQNFHNTLYNTIILISCQNLKLSFSQYFLPLITRNQWKNARESKLLSIFFSSPLQLSIFIFSSFSSPFLFSFFFLLIHQNLVFNHHISQNHSWFLHFGR
jgi:hypothetical protein